MTKLDDETTRVANAVERITESLDRQNKILEGMTLMMTGMATALMRNEENTKMMVQALTVIATIEDIKFVGNLKQKAIMAVLSGDMTEEELKTFEKWLESKNKPDKKPKK